MRFVAQVLLVAVLLVAAKRAPAQATAVPGVEPAPSSVKLGDEGRLARIVGLYEAGQYPQCSEELTALLRPGASQPLTEKEVIENARIYLAACLIGSNKPELADQPLRDAIRANPQMKPPDSLVFPRPVVDRFLSVQQTEHVAIEKAEQQRVAAAKAAALAQQARDQAEFERLRELERLARRETVVIENRRWIAAIPFGVGQFQNGDDGLGWVFLTSEGLLAATTLTALGMQTFLTLEAQKLKNPDNNAVLQTWNTLLDVSSYSLLAVAAIGVGQAQIAFVPDVRVERQRRLPERLRRPEAGPRIAPRFGVGREGFVLGIGGAF